VHERAPSSLLNDATAIADTSPATLKRESYLAHETIL
jgi:hypothetical protein